MVNRVDEKMTGSSKSSYQKIGPAKMIVRHNTRVDPNKIGARGRNVNSIFIETKEGERFKFPTTDLYAARAMTRHVGNGGSFEDDIGQHIFNLSEEWRNLARVANHISYNSHTLEEDALDFRGKLRTRVNEIKHNLNRMSKKRGYEVQIENLQESGNESSEFPEEQIQEEVDRLAKKLNIKNDDGLKEALTPAARVNLREDTDLDTEFNAAVESEDVGKVLDLLGLKISPKEFSGKKKEALFTFLRAYGPFGVERGTTKDLTEAVDQLASGNIATFPDTTEGDADEPKGFKDKYARLGYRLSNIAPRIKNDLLSNLASRVAYKLSHRGQSGIEPISKAEAQVTNMIMAGLNESAVNTNNTLKEYTQIVEYFDQFNPNKLFESKKKDEFKSQFTEWLDFAEVSDTAELTEQDIWDIAGQMVMNRSQPQKIKEMAKKLTTADYNRVLENLNNTWVPELRNGVKRILGEDWEEGEDLGPLEAYGVKGLQSKSWRKRFKSSDALNKWTEKHDAEVHGVRQLDPGESLREAPMRSTFSTDEPITWDEIEQRAEYHPEDEGLTSVSFDLDDPNVDDDIAAMFGSSEEADYDDPESEFNNPAGDEEMDWDIEESKGVKNVYENELARLMKFAGLPNAGTVQEDYDPSMEDEEGPPETYTSSWPENYEWEDLADMMSSQLGDMVTDQFRAAYGLPHGIGLEKDEDIQPLEEQNPNALRMIADFLRKKGEYEMSEEINEYLQQRMGESANFSKARVSEEDVEEAGMPARMGGRELRHRPTSNRQRAGAGKTKAGSIEMEAAVDYASQALNKGLGLEKAVAYAERKTGVHGKDIKKALDQAGGMFEAMSWDHPRHDDDPYYVDPEVERAQEEAYGAAAELKAELEQLYGSKHPEDAVENATDRVLAANRDVDLGALYSAFEERYGVHPEDYLPEFAIEGRSKENDILETWNKLNGYGKVNPKLNEGTWALPWGKNEAQNLARVMQQPIPASEATDVVGGLFGDDRLYDDLGDLADEMPDADARPVIADHLHEMLVTYNEDPSNFRDYLDPTASVILRDLANQYSSLNETHGEDDIPTNDMFDDFYRDVRHPDDEYIRKGGYGMNDEEGSMSPVGSYDVGPHHYFNEDDNSPTGVEGDDFDDAFMTDDEGKTVQKNLYYGDPEQDKKGNNDDGMQPLFPYSKKDFAKHGDDDDK